MAGRKPKPTALKLMMGNPGKRALPKNEPKPDTSVLPPCPPELRAGPGEPSTVAEMKWHQISDKLHRIGLLSNIDVDMLANYCELYARRLEAQKALKAMAAADPVTHGLLVRGPRGQVMRNPLVAVVRDCTTQMLKIAVEFGMTPSSRVRVSGAAGSGPAGISSDDEEAAEFFGD